MINVRKAAIIGCGFVGSSIAFSLMQRGLYSELVLIDANQAKAEGEAMDLSHGGCTPSWCSSTPTRPRRRGRPWT